MYDFEKTGRGPTLIFVHGWPFHRGCFDKIIPELSQDFTCYALNSMGMAFDGQWMDMTKMDFPDHGRRIIELADAEGLGKFSLIGHDTGATVARHAASLAGDRVQSLSLFNTEIPNHRPPFIPLFQKLMHLPFSGPAFRVALKSRAFRHSAMGFGNVVYDHNLLGNDFQAQFIDYWFAKPLRWEGLRRYLMGLDFALIDELDALHKSITAPTQFIWGENDKTFPVDLGRAMADRMEACVEFNAIKGCCFVPHQEKPKEVISHLKPFLKAHAK